MNREEVFEKALRSYSAYYDINRETPEAPFQAEAAFHSHSDAYFLVKSATLGEAESHEYVFLRRLKIWMHLFWQIWIMPPGRKKFPG